MATRFGGGAKGVVSVVEEEPLASFLAIKLADILKRSRAAAGSAPAVVMNSFATRGPSLAHLDAIGWGGLPEPDRYRFDQSVLPRVLPDGTPLADLDGSDAWPDTEIYTAPGHGDTLGQVRRSGVIERLQARGVEHVLVSNVDNLGASLDPVLVGAHVQAAANGSAMTVEVVERLPGDAGGCVALHPVTGRPAIIEGFRLPEGVDLGHYPHFNTNTLWFRLEALARPIDLQWFPVRKTISLGGAEPSAVVQFERLIGQASELVSSSYIVVDRTERFLPIKTRADLQTHRDRLLRYARDTGVVR
jgi:UTP--glucose-1-phosphate uridylyltransferase